MRRDERVELRTLRAEPLIRDGRELVALHDPLGISRNPDGLHGDALLVPAEIWSIARCFDGKHSFDEIATESSTRGGKKYSSAEVREIARGFSHRFLMRDERSEAELAVQHAFFKSSPERPCIGAGRDYSGDPIELRIEIGGLVANDWDMPATSGVFGVITPAANVRRAGKLYSRTYAALRHAGGSFARVLLLGQLREPLGAVLVPLEKPFATPFGALACDTDAVRALDVASSPNELAHRAALVLERQCLFLKLLFPRLPIVPVLVGALEQSSADVPNTVESAVEALERVLELSGKTLIVCACDLSSASGAGSNGSAPRDIRERDRLAVDHATRGDAEAYWREVSSASDSAHAAAWIAPYLFLRLCGERASSDAERGKIAGSVLGYQQLAPAESLTTAASVLFY